MNKPIKTEINIENAEHFDVDSDLGLTNQQYLVRKEEKLFNKTPKRVTKSYLRIFLDNVVNFFNILLFVIAALMLVAGIGYLRDGNYGIIWEHIPSYFFLVILLSNITIGLVQDINARRLVDKLKVVSNPKARVIRNGQIMEIESSEIVLSDIIILKTGDQIVADGEIVQGFVEVNESILTGESIDVKKTLHKEVFAGSFVTSGSARMIVTKVGKANYIEKLQEEAKTFKRPKSEIIKSLNYIFKIIGGIVIVLGTLLLVTFIIAFTKNGGHFWPLSTEKNQAAILSLAGSLVSMLPTGMYLLTSTTLAVGVIRLARNRMLVQELYSIEMLARVDTLCLDKTGTITDGSMNVKEVVTVAEAKKDDLEKILITIVKGTGDSNGTANAILKAYSNIEPFEVFKSFPFNSKKKMSAVSLTNGMTYVLGAREFININDSKILKKCEEHEAIGERVLIVASTKQPFEDSKNIKFEPIGVLILEDHIRDDAYENIEWFKNNGVDVKIISGDNALSVSKIAEKVGVPNASDFISLEGMELEEVEKIANKYTVFGRVSPAQKQVLVKALRDEGRIVAMTGDGVNDILALKTADCSIAMASGSAAARNISHLVSLDSNFSNLPKVVSEGRRVINNLQRTCSLFLVKTIFAVILTVIFMVVAWIKGVPNAAQIYPFTTKNMFIWEFATIGIAALLLSFQPNNEKLSGGFAFNIFKKAVPSAISMIAIVLITFLIHWVFPSYLSFDTARAISVIVYSMFSYVILFNVCWKFDIYRIVLFVSMLVFGIVAIVIDIFMPSTTGGSALFDIPYNQLDGLNWFLIIIIFAIAIPIFIGVRALFKIIENKLEEREKEL